MSEQNTNQIPPAMLALAVKALLKRRGQSDSWVANVFNDGTPDLDVTADAQTVLNVAGVADLLAAATEMLDAYDVVRSLPNTPDCMPEVTRWVLAQDKMQEIIARAKGEK